MINEGTFVIFYLNYIETKINIGNKKKITVVYAVDIKFLLRPPAAYLLLWKNTATERE